MEVQTPLHTRKGELVMRIRWTMAMVFAGIGALAIAAPAKAGLLVSSATSCDYPVYEKPFLPWADPANYVLAPSGTFDEVDGDWTLAGNAAVVSSNESY